MLFRSLLFLIVLESLILGGPCYAQFQGTISAGMISSSNVEGLDTSAPDRIVQPGISLQYLTQFSPVATYKLSASMNPYFYTQNNLHTYYSSQFGIGASYYLTNLQAIRAEANGSGVESVASLGKESNAQTTVASSNHTSQQASQTASSNDRPATSNEEGTSPADSLIVNATIDLYLVSGALDSLEFTGKDVGVLSDQRDSASQIISTLADLLDSLSFTQSVKEVSVSELKEIRPLIEHVLAGLKPRDRILLILDRSINDLEKAKPESDYLPTQSSLLPDSSSGLNMALLTDSWQRTTVISEPAATYQSDDEPPKAPIFTLIPATMPFRNLGAQDFDIPANLADAGATTFASSLQLPVTFEIRRDQPFYKIYNYSALTIEGTYENLPSHSTTLDLTYDLTNSTYFDDSIYSSIEHQIRLGTRTLLSQTTALFAEGIIGIKHYVTPLTVLPDSTNKLKRPSTVASSFFQYSLGLGLMHSISDAVLFGGLFTFSTNPTLRAYIDQIGNLSQRRATGISDDQYTYNLVRLMAFIQAKIFWGMMLNFDLSEEHRKYGSVVNRVTDRVTLLTGADRTERGVFTNFSLMKVFSFVDDRALSLFSDISVAGNIGYSAVSAFLPSGGNFPLYSYDDTEIGLTFSLGF